MFKGFSLTKYLKKKENKKNLIILGVQSMLLLGSTLWSGQLSSNHRISNLKIDSLLTKTESGYLLRK